MIKEEILNLIYWKSQAMLQEKQRSFQWVKMAKKILSTVRSANFPTATNAVPPLLRFWDKTRGAETGKLNIEDAKHTYTMRDTFSGTAKTTGAGELQLVSHKDEAGATEYFWTLTTPNQDKTIITPSAPAYALVPRQNLESGYAMLDTLHQRRGENQTLSRDRQGNYRQDAEATDIKATKAPWV